MGLEESRDLAFPQPAGRGTWREWIHLGFWVVLPLAVGTASAIVSQSPVDTWYRTLTKPAFTPPDAWFGPVWTALYILMGIAAHLALREARDEPRRESLGRAARVWFLVQLGLNGAWSILFFRLRSPGGGLIVIVALLVAIALTMRAFARLSRPAAWLLAPYLAWTSFAALLNATIWWLNR